MMPRRALAGLLAAAALLAAPLHAYEPQRGEPFFLLSDASYAADAEAMVRLEAGSLWAVADYGGVDVRVYRIPKPLEFLQKQKNLHRVDVAGAYTGEGLSNALSRVWDRWWVQSRMAWRKLFTPEARVAVTAQAPGTKSHPHLGRETPEQSHPQYAPLKGLEMASSFRYPVQFARPIEPPKGVKLAGSSSEFIKVRQGNVMIPLGKRKPGLYLVEAMLGEHRATTLVFVSDSVAVTKVSADQMLAWVAARKDGAPVAGANVVWSDGAGVLKSGATDAAGLAVFSRDAPEKTYVFGEDPSGGVFVSENYYYDSEIYNTRLYAVTDRPLYRPGDEVFVKFLGRELRSARETAPAASAGLQISVFDPGGFPVAMQKAQFASESGAATSFRLPENASAGGYELRFVYKGDAYSAAFRVAEYVKPHFEIGLVTDRREFRTGDPVSGKLQLAYPDGRPVANAKVELGVRAQRLTMVEGDLGYTGQFPVKLAGTSLTTDSGGMAAFSLPAAAEPSRYVLTALATDGAAYRVRATKEILIERGAGLYALRAEKSFSAPKETVRFAIRAIGEQGAAPVSWETIRLENRQRATGRLAAKDRLELALEEPGSYTINLRDANGNILGAASHWVSGAGIAAPQGTIEIVLDKVQYRPGETASALITFPQPVEHALVTLERDRVEKTALLAPGGAWVKTARVTPTQWRATLPVGEDYGPNVTLSVAFVSAGEYAFQNQGIRVEQPRIEIRMKPDRQTYLPGDKVRLELAATVAGKPAAGARLTVSVVDEMIYVLQPEIAPDIFDFFYHPRRNNVRTSASLAFIGYDLARPRNGNAAPSRRQSPERAVKILERPRREDRDTALWEPDVVAGKDGRATLEFTMPDSLTRWRVTARAADAAGVVGQGVSFLRSDKPLYAKWTSPTWLRASDAPLASLALFNQGLDTAVAELAAKGAGIAKTERVTLKPGANFVRLPLSVAAGDSTVNISLSAGGKVVDALSVPLRVIPVNWPSARSVAVPVSGAEAPLALPPDAANVTLRFADSAGSQFRRILDDLIDYPYGCVEQTASRLIPYSLAVQSLGSGEERLAPRLVQQLHTQRFRLAQYAGPKAVFGWWSAPEKAGDPLLTAYAYYADWHASRALALEMPAGHWDRLLDVYRTEGARRSPWHRALMLYWMQEMGLPVRPMASVLAEELAARPAGPTGAGKALDSVVLGGDAEPGTDPMARVLAAYLVQQAKAPVPAGLASTLNAATEALRANGTPLANALLLLAKRSPAADAPKVLEAVRAEMPTVDRALALIWIHRALGGVPRGAELRAEPGAPWQPVTSATGQRTWRLAPGTAVPATIALASAAPAGTQAVVAFESREPEQTKLPVTIERTLWKLKRIDPLAKPPAKPAPARPGQPEPQAPMDPLAAPSEFALEPVNPGAALRSDEVYLDQVVLRVKGGARLRYGIVEVALPPGATADRSTWGISVRRPGAADAEALERARFETTPTGYAFPIEELAGEITVRHLLRASQPGRFALPPVRYYRMYQPADKAFEEKPRARIEVR